MFSIVLYFMSLNCIIIGI